MFKKVAAGIASALLLVSLPRFFLNQYDGEMISGVLITLVELMISFGIFFTMQKSKVSRLFLIAPLGFAVGDFIYGLTHYVFRISFENPYGNLLFALPYIMGMFTLGFALYVILERIKISKAVRIHLIVFLVALLALNVFSIVIPSLTRQNPPLSGVVGLLAILFSALESWIVAASAILLVLVISPKFQLLFIGILTMHISDIAIRYQSVYAGSVQLDVIENGWLLGLIFIGSAISSIWNGNKTDPVSLPEVMPVFSIRVMTVFSLLCGLVIGWMGLTYYYQGVFIPKDVSITLLIVLGILCFAVIAANIVNSSLSRLALSISTDKPVTLTSLPKLLPTEILLIAERFQSISGKLAQERDHAINNSTKLAHDIRSPVSALEMVKNSMKKAMLNVCECKNCVSISDQYDLLTLSSEAIRNIAEDILAEKKRLAKAESVDQAIQKTLAFAKSNHPHINISAVISDDSRNVSVNHLTRVLTNIVNNAAEASEHGKSVMVRAERSLEYLKISVKDEGKGIPFNILEEMKLGRSISTKQNGNGIGFSSMINWAKDEGYELDIQSVFAAGESSGTDITIKIPSSLLLIQ
jgi:signal transduction histidine kinase